MPEVRLETLLAATGGVPAGPPTPAAFAGVSTDTRQVAPGELFVALRGEQFDGHDFVAEAFARGAGAALVSQTPDPSLPPGPLIVVSDTLQALGALAAAHRSEFSIPVIAITGSTGKTTTKEMVASILSQGWRTARTPGNYNNEIGVPLALLSLRPDHQAAVVELAMRGRKQIDALARMVRPQVGVITNIGVSHLEMLGSREAIAEAKAELLALLPADGVAVLNAECEFFESLTRHSPCRVVSFARDREADVEVRDIRVNPNGRTEFTLEGWWGELQASMGITGRHHALNAAAAAAAAMAAGARADWIAPGLETFEGAEMRSRVIRAPGGFTVIDDCYNAAPDSMRVALEMLSDLPGKRKWAVLGDMKELGPMTAEWHREVGALAAELGLAGVVAVGEMSGCLVEGARQHLPRERAVEASDNADAVTIVEDLVSAGDVVLVKGSRVMKMEQIVDRLVRPEVWEGADE